MNLLDLKIGKIFKNYNKWVFKDDKYKQMYNMYYDLHQRKSNRWDQYNELLNIGRGSVVRDITEKYLPENIDLEVSGIKKQFDYARNVFGKDVSGAKLYQSFQGYGKFRGASGNIVDAKKELPYGKRIVGLKRFMLNNPELNDLLSDFHSGGFIPKYHDGKLPEDIRNNLKDQIKAGFNSKMHDGGIFGGPILDFGSWLQNQGLVGEVNVGQFPRYERAKQINPEMYIPDDSRGSFNLDTKNIEAMATNRKLANKTLMHEFVHSLQYGNRPFTN